jgi:outer membrane protein assembly factor BamD (BamD/ComL family)
MFVKLNSAAVILMSATMFLFGCVAFSRRSGEPTVASRLEKAKTLYEENQLAAASRIFKKLANTSKYDLAIAEEAIFFLAECHYQQHRWVEAHQGYRKLLRETHSKRFFEPAVRREFIIGAAYCTGRVSTFWKRKGFGAKILKEALEYQPFGEHSAKAWLLLGDYYFENGNYDEALIDYELLIGEYRDTEEASQARYRRALCLYNILQGNRLDSKEIDEAIEGLKDAKEAISDQTPSKAASHRLSNIRQKLDDLRETSAKENYDLARFFLKNGNKKAAATYFHEVLETLEDVPDSRYVELARKALDNIAQENN